MAKPERYRESSEEIIVNLDAELFAFKRNSSISLIVGIILILFLFGGILGLFVTFIGLIVTGISIWWLYGLSNNRIVQTENSIRGRYEKIARKKGKRLVIVYNPEGQQFYPRQQTQSGGYQSVDTKVTYCPKCGSKVEPGYKFCMNCKAELS